VCIRPERLLSDNAERDLLATTKLLVTNPVSFSAFATGVPLASLGYESWFKNTRVPALPDGEKRRDLRSCTRYGTSVRQTNGRTDGRTDKPPVIMHG